MVLRPRGWSRRLSGALLVAVPLGASLCLDVAGREHLAPIERKLEDIRVVYDGEWTRTYRLEVAAGPGSSVHPVVAVSPDAYDRLHPGDTVRVRSLACCPVVARLAERNTGSSIADLAHAVLVDFRWAAWFVLGLVALVGARRLGRRAILLTGAAWLAAAVLLPSVDRVPPAVAPDWQPATARVTSSMRIHVIARGRRSDAGFALPQPYDILELRFVPAGARDSVDAVDAVDAGSVAGLAVGATLPIRYDPSAPRAARLDAGSRTHPARNRPLYWMVVGVVVAGATGLTWLLAPSLAERPRPVLDVRTA